MTPFEYFGSMAFAVLGVLGIMLYENVWGRLACSILVMGMAYFAGIHGGLVS